MVEEFIEYIRIEKRYSPRTLQLYRESVNELREFIAPLNSDEFIKELKPATIRSFIATNMEQGLSPATINLKLSAISSFCNYLIREEIISVNPVKKVYRPKTPGRLPHFYTENSMANYIEREMPRDDFFKFRDRVMVLMLYTTGMRRAEIAGLKFSQWDRGRGVIRVTGKGDKEREIPITNELSQILDDYLQSYKEHYHCEQDSLFFLTNTGKPLYLSFVNMVVKRELMKGEGFAGKKSPHILRHSIATHLLNNGADLNSIKEVLGHSSLAATQVYTHNSFKQMKKIFLTAHPRAKKGG